MESIQNTYLPEDTERLTNCRESAPEIPCPSLLAQTISQVPIMIDSAFEGLFFILLSPFQ